MCFHNFFLPQGLFPWGFFIYKGNEKESKIGITKIIDKIGDNTLGSYLLNNLMISFPLANISKAKMMIIPVICAYSMNLSLGLRRVIIS